MKGASRWDCSETEETDPACSEVASGVVTGAMTAATAGRTGVMTGVTGGMTAATGVADPGCCGDSPMRAPPNRPTACSLLSRAMRVHGSVTS